MNPPTIVVQPSAGRSVSLGGMGVVFKVSGADTGGAFAVVEHPIDPGRLVLPHVHLHEDEYSYVLEGTIGAKVGGHEVAVGPGSYLIKPRGLMHTLECRARTGQALRSDRPGGFRGLLRRTRGGRRPRPQGGAGGKVWGDLLIGLGRRVDLEIPPEITRSVTPGAQRRLRHEMVERARSNTALPLPPCPPQLPCLAGDAIAAALRPTFGRLA